MSATDVRAGAATRKLSVWRHPVLVVVIKRVATAIPLLFVVSALSFVLVSLTPGDAARQILSVNASQEQYEALRSQLGLDLPLYQQYGNWLAGAVTGDLGESLYTRQSVAEALIQRFPPTLSLILGSLVVSLVVGVGIGLLGAARGGGVARAVDAVALLGFSLPSFWVGTLLIATFAVALRLFPATGYVPFEKSPGGWVYSLVLPVAALAVATIAAIAKQTRDAMVAALSSEYIRMARANGVGRGSLIFRHALKNSSARVVTVLGIQAVALLSGTVVIEVVFSIPGLGSLAVDATVQSDIPLIQGIAVLFTILVVFINLAIDLISMAVNPKVRTS